MATKFPRLFSQFQLGNQTLKNRLAVAPMTRISSHTNGVPTDEMVPYYQRYAKGGFGLIITEGVYTDLQYSQGYPDQPGIVTEEQIKGWEKVVSGVHEAANDAKLYIQLMHAGAASQRNEYSKVTKGPSAFQPPGEKLQFYMGEGPYATSEALTLQEIEKVLEGFVDTAVKAKKAGFDGIELHGANGYVLDEFLTKYINQRTDKYGGSTENRVQFLVEVCEAVRAAVGKDYPLGIRISQSKVFDFQHKWEGKEKDAEVIFGKLGSTGIDFIHTTEFDGTKGAFEESGPTLASLAKQYGNVAVIGNGELSPPEKAEAFLETGDADLVSLGKSALANKDWPLRVANGEKLKEFEPMAFFAPTAKVKDFEL